MIGTSLIFVGITLMLNGIVGLAKWQKKDLLLLNLLTGGLIVVFNVYGLITNSVPKNNIQHFGALLFGFTNIFIAVYSAYSLNDKFFGCYCFFSSFCALFIGIYFLVSGLIFAGIMWLIWLTIWLFSFIAFSLNEKFVFATNIMFVLHGFFSTFAVGFLILFDIIKLY